MGAYRVSFVIGFVPQLTIARQQSVLERLEALRPQTVDLTGTECTLAMVLVSARADLACDEAENRVARALAAAGHTMATAPIRSRSVDQVSDPT